MKLNELDGTFNMDTIRLTQPYSLIQGRLTNLKSFSLEQ